MSWSRSIASYSRFMLARSSAPLRFSCFSPTLHSSKLSSRSPLPNSRHVTTRAGTKTTPTEAESSVARGTRYELLCRSVLHEIFGMHLERTGGAGDRGIDLRGWWQPPPLSPSTPTAPRIRIVAQCKCQDEGGKKMGPVLVREMEGVLFRASSPSPSESEEGERTAGIILSSSGFSKQALLQVRSSSVPLAAMHVRAQAQGEAEEGEKAERCVAVVWNDKFGGEGRLVEGGLEVRWSRSVGEGRPVVWRGERPLKG